MKLVTIVFAALVTVLASVQLASTPASAAPAVLGAMVPLADSQSLTEGLVQDAQYYYRRPHYRRRYVCRIRYTYYGPRRVCHWRYY